jgi:hypothetical protein
MKSDEEYNQNENKNKQDLEKDNQILDKEKSGTDILDNTHDNNYNNNNIIYNNNTEDNNDSEIIQKIEMEAPEINEKDLQEKTLKETNNNKKMKKTKTNHNPITNKKDKIKVSDKEINKTVEDNNTNDKKLNIIMRNEEFTNIKSTSLNTYNNSYELKEPSNKSVFNKKSVNKGITNVNKKNNIKSKTIEIPYDNRSKKKPEDNIIQSKNGNGQCENKKENKFIKNKTNSSLTGKDKSNDNILSTSKQTNKRSKNDSVLSTSNIVNKKSKIPTKQSLKKKHPQVEKEPHNSKK